jgi:hypothetical protein
MLFQGSDGLVDVPRCGVGQGEQDLVAVGALCRLFGSGDGFVCPQIEIVIKATK